MLDVGKKLQRMFLQGWAFIYLDSNALRHDQRLNIDPGGCGGLAHTASHVGVYFTHTGTRKKVRVPGGCAIHALVCACADVRMCVCADVRVRVCVCVCVYVCVCVCVCCARACVRA